MNEPLAFSPRHRRALIVLLSLLLGYIGLRVALNPTLIAVPQANRPMRESELADRIDPNTADVPTLAALPGIGMKRAGEIVAYRDAFVRKNPGRLAFNQPADLLKIRGFGYATMTRLTPYFIFPASERATTRPRDD